LDPVADVVTLTASVGAVVDNDDGSWNWSFNTGDGPDQGQVITITATDSDGAKSTKGIKGCTISFTRGNTASRLSSTPECPSDGYMTGGGPLFFRTRVRVLRCCPISELFMLLMSKKRPIVIYFTAFFVAFAKKWEYTSFYNLSFY